MSARRIQWQANMPDGTPVIINGVIADVDEETGSASLSARTHEVIAEVLANNPHPSRTGDVVVLDLAEEVHRLIQAKHAAGIPIRSPLPKPPADHAFQATEINKASDD